MTRRTGSSHQGERAYASPRLTSLGRLQAWQDCESCIDEQPGGWKLRAAVSRRRLCHPEIRADLAA